MTRADMDGVRNEFVRAAEFGLQAGFDMLELHMAHGYLLASFLSPLTNHRRDPYGGGIANRLRFPLEVLEAVRAVWPADKPLSVRISATDWAAGGLSSEDMLAAVRAFQIAGLDLVDVSTGQTVPDQKPLYGRMWQTPFADEIRNELGIATMAVGNTSTSTITSTRSLPRAAPTCVPWRALTWRTPPGRSKPRPNRATSCNGGRISTSRAKPSSKGISGAPGKPEARVERAGKEPRASPANMPS